MFGTAATSVGVVVVMVKSVAAQFTVAALLGVSVGKNIADRLPTVTLVRWFVGLLVVLAAYVSLRARMALVSA